MSLEKIRPAASLSGSAFSAFSRESVGGAKRRRKQVQAHIHFRVDKVFYFIYGNKITLGKLENCVTKSKASRTSCLYLSFMYLYYELCGTNENNMYFYALSLRYFHFEFREPILEF